MRRLSRAADVFTSLLRVGFAAAVAYRSEFIVWLLSTNTPLIMLVLWSAVAADEPLGRFGQRQFAAYFVVTLIVRLLSGAWVVWELNMDVRSGALGMRLLRPLHPFLHYAAENLAAWPLRFATTVPVIVVLFVAVGPAELSQDAREWALVPFAIAGAWALTFSAMLAIGTLSLFWQSSLAVFQLWMTLYFVLSGYVVPLELFPPGLQRVVAWLPFRYIIGFPVETVLGLVSFETALGLLARQWCYVAGFATLAVALWRVGVRRYEAFGG